MTARVRYSPNKKFCLISDMIGFEKGLAEIERAAEQGYRVIQSWGDGGLGNVLLQREPYS